MKYPSACLFPTTTVFLDDEPDFLAALLDNITMPTVKLKPFANHDDVASYLDAHLGKHELNAKWMKKTSSDDVFENTAFEICYNEIQQEIYNQNRTKRATTLVVDYQMPHKNGLDFIKSLSELPIKKILLTGIADLNIGINAVNDNLIDAFFKKEDEDLVTKLSKKLNEYHFDYFFEHSQLIKRSLTKLGDRPLVESAAFQRLFASILQATKAVEYYLIDENCSYIFFDKHGRHSKLLIKSKDQLECEHGHFYIARELSCGSLFPLDANGQFYYEIR